jgi:hypothetical protein
LMVLSPRAAMPPAPPEAKSRAGDGGSDKGSRIKKRRVAKAN